MKMTPPLVAFSPREPQTQNEKFFQFQLAESADGLKSFQAQSAGEL